MFSQLVRLIRVSSGWFVNSWSFNVSLREPQDFLTPLRVLTGCLRVILIPQLKITKVFCSMYVTGLGGATPGGW